MLKSIMYGERYDFLNINLKLENLANFEFLGVSNLSTNSS